MPRKHLPNYLRTERLRAGLSQRELGELCGMSRSAVAKAENARPPTLRLTTAIEIVFGHHAPDLFPTIYAGLERRILVRALIMQDALAGRSDPISRKKQDLLGALIARLERNSRDL